MKKHYIIVPLFLLVSGLLIFISIYNITEAPKPKRVIIVGKTSDPSIQFWNIMQEGFAAAAREFNIDYGYVAPENEDQADKQIEILQEAIAQKPDAIVMIASDYYKLKEGAQKVKDNNIRLVMLDSKADIDGVPFIATNNVEAGIKAGQQLSSVLSKKGKAAIISQSKITSSAKEREAGFREGFGDDQRIAAVLDCENSKKKAFDLTYELLKANPDIEGLVGLNEVSTLGAAEAVKFLQKKTKLVGFDSSFEEIKLLEEGVISAIVVQQPFNMGYLALKTAQMPVNQVKTDSKGNIYTDSVLITSNNIYDTANQKLLFPLTE